MNTIINSIKKLLHSKRTFFTTPTHRMGGIIPAGLKNIIGYKAYNSDFSEVDGLDNLKNPNYCVLKSQTKAAEVYGTKATFFLTQGASSGMLTAIMSAVKENDKILVARNAHESVYNALVLTGAIPVWFLPDYNEKFGINCGITLLQIQNEYEKNPDIKAIVITSPTYEGIVSDVKAICDFCRLKNIICIVDEAHGALFPFSEKLPDSAIVSGADFVIHSLHKTTPALTGSALLHVGKNSVIDVKLVQRNLNLITTTSPSWLIIASIEGAINFLETKKCKDEIDKIIENILELQSTHENFEFLSDENHDPTKIFITKKGFSAKELSDFLDENNIEDELAGEKGVLCLCGIGTTKKKIKRLSNVLKKFHKKSQSAENGNFIRNLPVMKYAPRQVFDFNIQEVDKTCAIGKVIAENITPYPPCIPILMAGEVIESRHLKFLNEKVCVVKDE